MSYFSYFLADYSGNRAVQIVPYLAYGTMIFVAKYKIAAEASFPALSREHFP